MKAFQITVYCYLFFNQSVLTVLFKSINLEKQNLEIYFD